jgi:putative phosphoserine phosphatase / 1-acylglycerol-3-phosphate O-acyltransferase
MSNDQPGGDGVITPTATATGIAGSTKRGAVFVDLDRTLLRGASGPVIDRALRAEGLLEGRPRLPASGLLYGFYDLFGETLPMMVLVRSAAHFVSGWPEAEFRHAGERAAPFLTEMLQPFALAVLEGHKAQGLALVLSTTTPVDLVAPFAESIGFDDVVATRYARSGGTLSGGIEGDFVWGLGKLAAVRRYASNAGIDLSVSHAYSDSIYDAPLLRAVGHPHALRPDVRLRGLARVLRWPIEHWDRPDGVPKIAGVEPYHLLRMVVRPELFPYARFDIAGTERIPSEGAVLIAANHRSYFDVVALALVAAQLGRPVRFLAKRELFDAPVIGQVTRAIGGIPVDRGSGSDRPLREATRALKAGEVVVILPQGTIPRGRAFFDPELRGRTGVARLAQATGAPVIPVGIWGTEKIWPRSSRVPDVLTVSHPPKVRVRVGRPLNLTGRDASAETARLMIAISALLPKAARVQREPTAEELARSYPPGRRPSTEEAGAHNPSTEHRSDTEHTDR